MQTQALMGRGGYNRISPPVLGRGGYNRDIKPSGISRPSNPSSLATRTYFEAGEVLDTDLGLEDGIAA
ncbi:hypothetical protein KCU98_g7487, partial [Aureobasidium melanogenum]